MKKPRSPRFKPGSHPPEPTEAERANFRFMIALMRLSGLKTVVSPSAMEGLRRAAEAGDADAKEALELCVEQRPIPLY